ncbi:hypothetical protein QA648_27575 (plasmid) [Rhizobium sp. CB3171]|uniref:hypothetical protein n=1 Tax=Rhizobium sp. CB3171 TaxID=3039157 RepID=UPI0024B12986|nr:hypothetical protein [Rhizobium sp. CB3171]WFU04543.1 hypothetical protein QA648_27575 [Rhizobium sp. CB3171]
MSLHTTTLSIWGVPLEFSVQAPNVLIRLEDEFAGSIVASSETASHRFVHLCGELTDIPDEPLRARHRGGSSGDKRYIDGRIFKAETQNRDAVVVEECDNTGIYILDGCVVATDLAKTVILGASDKPHVLADLVEAFLLDHARAQGWMQCHGAGWLRADGGACLAVGPSGAGKTTRLLGSISETCRFLGNDRLFLRWSNGRLETRGYPLAMNVGCGTIRGLKLNIPHFDGEDHEKIRLTPRDVQRIFPVDYDNWYPVAEIAAPDVEALLENLYVEPDPSHPNWNVAWRREIPTADVRSIVEAATAPELFKPTRLKAVGNNLVLETRERL